MDGRETAGLRWQQQDSGRQCTSNKYSQVVAAQLRTVDNVHKD